MRTSKKQRLEFQETYLTPEAIEPGGEAYKWLLSDHPKVVSDMLNSWLGNHPRFQANQWRHIIRLKHAVVNQQPRKVDMMASQNAAMREIPDDYCMPGMDSLMKNGVTLNAT